MIKYKAKAKLNLFLHLIDAREDGYHNLESLAAFTDDIYDELSFTKAAESKLLVKGAFADSTLEQENIILKVIENYSPSIDLMVNLEKNIPVAAGMGGGSSDAAITLKALKQLSGIDISHAMSSLACNLGADVPVCLQQQASYFKGVGEEVFVVRSFPKLFAVIVNPGIKLSTKDVFRGSKLHFSKSLGCLPKHFVSPDELIDFIRPLQNGLLPSALAIQPCIAHILEKISKLPNCILSRMSGSGSTCFGLFKSRVEAINAESILRTKYPSWWVKSTSLS